MKVRNYTDGRQQLRALFYKIAADIKNRQIESRFLDNLEILDMQSSNVSYPAFRNRKGGKVISVSGSYQDDAVELSIHDAVELTFSDHDAYHKKNPLFWFEEDWPLKVSVSASQWETLCPVALTDVWESSRAVIRFFLKEAQLWEGDDAITDNYIDQICRSAYPEATPR
ncbi:hypothetical protein [Trinickia sp.]|uniref:hypothetical protein n=1 Tax=Trinickia sp. TaxID=2571163 RepID=UPI003F7CE04B